MNKDSVDPFEFGARIIETLVLVPYDKYQRLLDAQPVKMPSPTTPTFKVCSAGG